MRPNVDDNVASASAPVQSTPPPFTLFESGQVRPLAVSKNGKRLFAVNTPANRLEIFNISGDSGPLVHSGSIPVGLEPVAIAVRSQHEVWVVNHLSDSVSIVHVDHDGQGGQVERTLLVSDEPRDIVFAGSDGSRAFITTAHRGQNNPTDPQLTTPGVGRADVWVFDANNLGSGLEGAPLNVITLFSDTPRALAVTPDGSRVYAAAFHSGNRTTTLDEGIVTANGGLPPPIVNAAGEPQPATGLIVKYNGTHWVDELQRNWDDKVRFSLPDKDVFVLDATANPPAQLSGSAGYFQGVGTTLFNMAVNPVSGKVYVTNTDALNDERFEGAGVLAGHSVRGRFVRNRITVLGPAGAAPRHLDKHIDYSSCCAPVPNADNAKSLAIPTGVTVSSNGQKLYVAALGSSKVGVFDTAALEADTFVPSTANQIPLTGGGPTGLVLGKHDQRLFVLTRFDNSISVVDTASKLEIAHVSMHDAEPQSVKEGRRFLYDASFSSSHGDTACASCHVFGDLDQLAWDLGDPDAATGNMPGPFAIDPAAFGIPRTFPSAKGPMTTQSLRGMANHGPMHWRGDRTGGNDAPSAQPDSGTFDEEAAFKKFNAAFTGLLGRSDVIPAADLERFTRFALQITYPPNPIRHLDNSLTADQQKGRDFFFNNVSDLPIPPVDGTCQGCHTLDAQGNAQYGVAAPGFFGADGRYTAEPETQPFKIAHLRNMYQKVGMFGMASNPVFNPGGFDFTGDQIRGFGFLHDGGHDTMFRFHNRVGFNQTSPFGSLPQAFPDGASGDTLRRQVEAFMLVFDSNLAPIVGQQITLTGARAAAVGPRIDLLIARAGAGECELVAKGVLLSREVGFFYLGGSGKMFARNRSSSAPISDAALRQLFTSAGHPLTYTCVPTGSGHRLGLDRDGDGVLDGDEAALSESVALDDEP
jgi:DNA-binding beta-propeller fold protein YncE